MQGDVVSHRARQIKAGALAILGDEGCPQSDGVGGASDTDLVPVSKNASAFMRSGAEERLDQLGATGSHQAADPQDLAAAYGEADVLDLGRGAPPLHLEDRLAQGHLQLGEDVVELTADHHGDELLLREG